MPRMTNELVQQATSRTWWQIPPIARVTLSGALQEGVTGKDVIVALCSLFKDDVLNHAVEFTGPGLESLPVEYAWPYTLALN